MSEQTNLTAVEWIIKQLSEEGMLAKIDDIVIAKQMEKEQYIRDYNAGYADAQCNHINDAENYVNEIEYLNDDAEIKGWTIGPFGTPEKEK